MIVSPDDIFLERLAERFGNHPCVEVKTSAGMLAPNEAGYSSNTTAPVTSASEDTSTPEVVGNQQEQQQQQPPSKQISDSPTAQWVNVSQKNAIFFGIHASIILFAATCFWISLRVLPYFFLFLGHCAPPLARLLLHPISYLITVLELNIMVEQWPTTSEILCPVIEMRWIENYPKPCTNVIIPY